MLQLDSGRYYDRMELPLPSSRSKIFDDYISEKFIKKNDAGNWDITNLGALMIGKNLKSFESLIKRSIRVISYKGNDRLEGIREREFTAGYAFSHEDAVQYIMAIIPQAEVIDGATRHSVTSFPEITIRELLANCMIHQALDQRGTNPMVEIFDDRIENQNNQFTKAILFAKIPFDITTKADRVRTCYMLACLKYINFGAITNADIRMLFGLDESSKVKASRVIKDTLATGLIKPVDPETAPRYMKYIPIWA